MKSSELVSENEGGQEDNRKNIENIRNEENSNNKNGL